MDAKQSYMKTYNLNIILPKQNCLVIKHTELKNQI